MKLEDYILIRYIDQIASTEEVEMVDAWIQASSENRKHFQELLTVHYESRHLKSFTSFDVDQEWEALLKKNDLNPKPIENRFFTMTFVKYAAAASLLLICAFYFLFSSPSKSLISSGDQMITLQLPDNSSVELFPNSSLEFDKEWDEGDRLVVLQGKAKFNVRKSTHQHFVVLSDLMSTKVLGTEFMVDAYTTDLQSVEVFEGKVAVADVKDKSNTRLLNKGNFVLFKDGTLEDVQSRYVEPEPVVEKPKPAPKPKKVVKKKVQAPVQKPVEKPKPAPKPVEKKPEVVLSTYSVNSVFDYLLNNHPEKDKFSKSRKAKISDDETIDLSLSESLEKIIKRLETKYILTYDDEKCENCIDLKKIEKK